MSEYDQSRQDTNQDKNMASYDFTPEESATLKKEADENIQRGLHHSEIKIDWDKVNSTSSELPSINIENSDDIDEKVLKRTSDTLKRCALVAGLFEKNEKGEIIMDSLKVSIVEDSELGGDAASANLSGIKINKDFLTKEGVIDKKSITLDKIFEGKDLHEADQTELNVAVNLLRDITLAHEIYHLRQKHILYHTSNMNLYRHSPTNIPKQDTASLLQMKKKMYEYSPSERAADSFAIRYLKEVKMTSDTEEKIKQKIINQQIDIQVNKSSNLSFARTLDKKIREK